MPPTHSQGARGPGDDLVVGPDHFDSFHPELDAPSQAKMRAFPSHRASFALALLLAGLVSGCSGGSGASSAQTESDFAIESINVLSGQEWKINRPIDITFNEDVDFSTVSFNTIRIVDPFTA